MMISNRVNILTAIDVMNSEVKRRQRDISGDFVRTEDEINTQQVEIISLLDGIDVLTQALKEDMELFSQFGKV